MRLNTPQLHSGFSLIELMVSLTIFSIVMVSSIGTLLVLIDANGKAQAVSSATTNLAFAVDSMTRNIRTGRDFYCTNHSNSFFETGSADKLAASFTSTRDCLTSADGANDAIVFTPGFSSTTRIAYRLNPTAGGGVIEQWIDRPSQSDYWVPITSNQPPAAVDITNFKFIVEGSGGGDDLQPEVSVYIAGAVQNGLASSTPFRIQSTVTQRVLNY